MADSVVLEALERKGTGTREARKLRRQGLVPAVLYGHKEATVAVTLPGDVLSKAIRHGVRVVDLKQGANLQKALIRDVQWDPLGHAILHVDFARVSLDERVTLDVRVELRGIAPGVAAGGSLAQSIHNLSVECLAIAVPESIRVNIGELQLNQALYVKNLVLPEGVIAKNDPDAIVVQVVPQVAEEATTAPAAETAEPEVIGRKVEEAEAEE